MENKGVHTFPKGICPKVNVIARLEYELAYYDSAVHRFNHYTTRTSLVCVRAGMCVWKLSWGENITIKEKKKEGRKQKQVEVRLFKLWK